MKKLLAVAAVAACATGCVMPGVPNCTMSAIALDVRAPGQIVDASVKPAKCGEATTKGIICFAEGDGSIKAAMEKAGITKVHHVDYKVTNIFGIIGSTTTYVYGE